MQEEAEPGQHMVQLPVEEEQAEEEMPIQEMELPILEAAVEAEVIMLQAVRAAQV